MSATAGSSHSAKGRGRWASAAWRRVRRVSASGEWRDWLASQVAAEANARSAFFLLPVGMMLGIAAVYGFGCRPSAVGSLLSSLCLLALGVRWTEYGRQIVLTTAFGLLGAALSVFEIARNDMTIFSGETTVRVEGRVLWRDRDERERMRYLVAIERTDRPVLSRPPTRAEILVSSKHRPIPLGQAYRGLVRLRAPSGPAYPNGYDFAFGAFFERLGAYGFALGPPDASNSAESSGPLSIGERLIELRLAISDRIRERIGGAEGAVASAIVTGERTGIPDDVDKWLRATGLSHVLSISGLHMALVAGFAMTLVRGFCAAIPFLALNWPAKKVAAIIALLVSGFYLALSGIDVATTRSFIMIAIMLTAVVFDRSALTLRNVAIAALVVLALTPHALVTASFQMSFGATMAIVAAYGAFARWRHRAQEDGDRKRNLATVVLLSLLGIAASSMVAGAATAPFAAYHFQRIAPFGLIANMLALPIFSFWIMPLALIAMIAMPFGLDQPFLWLLGKGLSLVFSIAHFLYERIPDEPTGIVTTPGLVALAVALLIACLFASAFRLVAVPVAIAGLLLAPDRAERPELLVFEDGKEIALVDGEGRLDHLKRRPNRFVSEQWQRAFPAHGASAKTSSPTRFACEIIADEPAAAPTPASRSAIPASGAVGAIGAKPRRPPKQFCRATTRSGLRVAWTDDYRLTGRACDEGDIAIVARAVRLTICRSNAVLVTLRSLRTTGSLAVSRSPDGKLIQTTATFSSAFNAWNVHRAAPWPEAWRSGTVYEGSNIGPAKPNVTTTRPFP